VQRAHSVAGAEPEAQLQPVHGHLQLLSQVQPQQTEPLPTGTRRKSAATNILLWWIRSRNFVFSALAPGRQIKIKFVKTPYFEIKFKITVIGII
jgi:hypothetical protein